MCISHAHREEAAASFIRVNMLLKMERGGEREHPHTHSQREMPQCVYVYCQKAPLPPLLLCVAAAAAAVESVVVAVVGLFGVRQKMCPILLSLAFVKALTCHKGVGLGRREKKANGRERREREMKSNTP